MKLEQSFDVAAPLERVWKALVDVEHVAPCLPGAAVTGRNDDGSYNGTFTIKIGPTTAAYAGKLEMDKIDEAAHSATMQANGTDKRGQGGAKATIVSSLSKIEGGGTRVAVDTEYQITGRLARFGRGGMIEDISERLLREFAARLQASLVADGEPAATEPAGAAEAPASARAASESAAAPESEPAAESAPAAEGPPAAESEPAAEGPPAAPVEPLDAGSLVGSVLLERIRRNPAPLAFVAGMLLAFILLRGRRR
jgi:carbon monoxide dehydrogenase subunit G